MQRAGWDGRGRWGALQSPPGHASSRRSAASAPLTPAPLILLSLPRSSRRKRRKQSRFLKSWGREDFRAMGGGERRAGAEAGNRVTGGRVLTPAPEVGGDTCSGPSSPPAGRGCSVLPLLLLAVELFQPAAAAVVKVDGSASGIFSPNLLAQQPGATGRGGCAVSGDARCCQERIINK